MVSEKKISNGSSTSLLDHAWCFDLPLNCKPLFFNASLREKSLWVSDLLQDGGWNSPLIQHLTGLYLTKVILGTLIHTLPEEDIWTWGEDFLGNSLNKSAYCFFLRKN